MAPEFTFPLLGGGTVSTASLRGQPTVIALWSTRCHQSRRALAALDSLLADYRDRNLQVLVLAGDSDTLALRQVLDSAAVTLRVAVAGKDLWTLFDHSATAPERDQFRVAFGLPSFLFLDRSGVIVDRAAGVELGPVRLIGVRMRVDTLLAHDR